MTRSEFLESVDNYDLDWDDLKEFCNEEDCPVCDDVYDDSDRDDYIDDELENWAYNEHWSDIRDRLTSIPVGYDWWQRDAYGDWNGLDDGDFQEYVHNVVRWMDEHGAWDEEEDNEYYSEDYESLGEGDTNEAYEDEDDEELLSKEEAENVISELLIACNVGFQKICTDSEEEQKCFEAETAAKINSLI